MEVFEQQKEVVGLVRQVAQVRMVDLWVVEVKLLSGSACTGPAWVVIHLAQVEVVGASKLFSQELVREALVQLLAVLIVDVLVLLESAQAMSRLVVAVSDCLIQSSAVRCFSRSFSALDVLKKVAASSQELLSQMMDDMPDHVVAVLHEHLVLLEVDVQSQLSLEVGPAELSHVEAAGSTVSSVFPLSISVEVSKTLLFHLLLEVVLLHVVAKFCFLRVALQPLSRSSMRPVCTRWRCGLQATRLVALELVVLVEAVVLLSEVKGLVR